MKSKSLGILAVVIIVVMAIVATAGLDNLPRNLQSSVVAASEQISKDRTSFEEQRKKIERALQQEPALFRTRAAAWRFTVFPTPGVDSY